MPAAGDVLANRFALLRRPHRLVAVRCALEPSIFWKPSRRLIRSGLFAFPCLLLCCLSSPVLAQVEDESSSDAPARDGAVPGEVLVRFRLEAGRVAPAASLRGLPFQAESVRWLAPASSRVKLQAAGAAVPSAMAQMALVRLPPNLEVNSALEWLRRCPEVFYAEPNYRLRICTVPTNRLVPNDFEFGKQWGLENTGQSEGSPGADIHAPAAWVVTNGSPNVTVGIIDTGIDYFHPDLEGNTWINPDETPGNGVDDDQNGYIDDVYGYDFVSDDSDPMDDQSHGTHVAGIIGAIGDNRIGIAGVCWQVSLMALKAFNDRGEASVADVVSAINYAVSNGARILNASWSSSERSVALMESVAEARACGLLFVAAAGNNRSSALVYPAAYESALAVAAANPKDERSEFSNFGAYVDLAAPGENIYSTFPNNQYEPLSGTSMAAPHVAGVAALVFSLHPDFTNLAVENILRNAVDPIFADKYIGAGRLNAAKALSVRAPLPTANLRLPAIIFGRINLEGTASGERFASYSLEYGRGVYPTNWTSLGVFTVPVQDGVLLADVSTADLEEQIHAFKLTVTDTLGQTATAWAMATVRNVYMSSPLHNDVLRAGEVIPIQGTVFGPGRSYALQYGVGWRPTEWLAQGVLLRDGGKQQVLGGLLATWDTRLLATNQFYTLRLTATKADQTVGEWFAHMVYLDGCLRAGWPQYLPLRAGAMTNDWHHVVVADLDRDGAQELVVVDAGDPEGKSAHLRVYHLSGNVRWSRPIGRGEPYSDIPVVGDIDLDGFSEVFVDAGDRAELVAFRHDGSALGNGWPVRLEATNLGKVLADLDGDGFPEIVAFAQRPVRKSGQDWRQLLVINRHGVIVRRWEVPSCLESADAPKMLPAVGNLDKDADLEIVATLGCNMLGLFDLDKTNGPVWATPVEGAILSSPVVGDLDGDGRCEIVVGVADPKPAATAGIRGGLYAFDQTGRQLRGWPVLVGESFLATPALADFDGDGDLEIVIPGWSTRKLHLVHHHGFEAPGWPVGPLTRTGASSSPLVADINGDNSLEVVMVSPGKLLAMAMTGDLSTVGGILAWDFGGVPVDLNDRDDMTAVVMESAGGSSRFKAAPLTLTDLDGDGKLDIVAATIEDLAYSPDAPHSTPKQRYSVYAWGLDVPFVATNAVWPCFQHDPAHTGYLEPPRRVNQPPKVVDIPDQTVKTGTAFFPIQLDRYVEDPDDPPDQISWTVEGTLALEVIIGPDRVAVVQPKAPNWTGTEVLRFVARDPEGLEAENSPSFSMRVDYEPPVAVPDQATVLEDQAVEINVLTNDSDPRGYPLTVLDYSKPRNGSVQRAASGNLVYRPAPDFNGLDDFTYVISNGKDGMAIGLVSVEVLPVEDPPVACDDRAITLEDVAVQIEVLANDKDADGDALDITNYTQPEFGVLTRVGLSAFNYYPKANSNGLDQFTYTITDHHGAESTGSVLVMVKPVNDTPVARDLAFTLNRNTQQDMIYQATDPDGDELSFKVIKGPEHGSLWNYPKVATYYPQKGYAGPDSLMYEASDGELQSLPATISFTVLPVNNSPKPETQSLVTRIGRPLPISLKATDPDDDPLSYQVTRFPQHGSLGGAGTNYVYQPDEGFVGEDGFGFQVSDGQSQSALATVAIRVTDQNTAPIAADFTVQAAINKTTLISLKAIDGENDPLVYTVLSPPLNGTLSGTSPDLLYTPALDYLGPDRFTFKVSDGQLESGVATASIRVAVPNHGPEANDQSIIVLRNEVSPVPLALSDADGDRLRCAILKGPRSGRLFGTGTNFVYSPSLGYTGTDSFTYKVWDGHIYSQVAKVTVFISAAPPPAAPSFPVINLTENGEARLVLKSLIGKNITVLASTNLYDWHPLTNLVTQTNWTVLIDTNAGWLRQRFYRAVQY
jgi:subtilisin family serine protease